MPIRGVLFDLGGTLLSYNAPGTDWEATERKGAGAVYRRLLDYGYSLPPEDDAYKIVWDYTLSLWSGLDAQPASALKLDRQWQVMAGRWGVNDLPPELLNTLAIDYMAAIQSHVYPLEGAADTLRALRGRGLRIGLISNTVWPGAYHRDDLERHGLIGYLDHLVFSADAETWKPHRAVFQLGLEPLHITAEEACFVGDSLYFDVWGAQQAGMRGVWIEQVRRWLPPGVDVTPDATIRRLPELLDVVERWS